MRAILIDVVPRNIPDSDLAMRLSELESLVYTYS